MDDATLLLSLEEMQVASVSVSPDQARRWEESTELAIPRPHGRRELDHANSGLIDAAGSAASNRADPHRHVLSSHLISGGG